MPRAALSCLVSVSALALLAACGPEDRPTDNSSRIEAETAPTTASIAPRPQRDAVASIQDARALRAPAAPRDRGGVPQDSYLSKPVAGAQAMPVVAPSLAYEYGYALELPADKARGQLTAHQSACEEVGPAVCR